MNVKALLAALAVPAMVCATLNASSVRNHGVHIIKGEPAKNGDFPYAVSLWYEPLEQHFCTGSLLDETTVLTAAHCTIDYYGTALDSSDYHVRAGSLSHLSGGVVAFADSIIVHPEFSASTLANDVAILKLAVPIREVDGIEYATLAAQGTDPDTDTDVTVAGWGFDADGDTHAVEFLRKVDVPIVSRKKCAARWRPLDSYHRIGKNQICVGYVKADGRTDEGVCGGDSGGPLVDTKTGAIVGITSWGPRLCEIDGTPNVFTRVGAYRDFIDKHMGGSDHL